MALKTFPIDYIRQVIDQTLLQEHIKNVNFLGGENQVSLFSFYEQLVSQDEVDRYVERYRDLADQQNRSGIIANGVIVAPENPTITNLNQVLIVPMTFMATFRCKIGDRDSVLETLNNLISIHKGRKVDIAELDNGKLFMVGTIANNSIGSPLIRNGDFIGIKTDSEETVDTFITGKLTALSTTASYTLDSTFTNYLYFEEDNKIKVAIYNSDDSEWEVKTDENSYDDVIFPPAHNSFTKYKVSLSFDSIRCDEPRNLNGSEFVQISLGGSATLTNASVLMGNDLTKLAIKRTKLVGESDTTYADNYTWLEPLEQPSSSNADTQLNRLMSNNFVNNTHTDALTLSTQYTFIIDKSIDFLKYLYEYARYGKQTYITPNIIYTICEITSSWGEVSSITYLAKIIESIDIENTESDVMQITLPLQIQGENN